MSADREVIKPHPGCVVCLSAARTVAQITSAGVPLPKSTRYLRGDRSGLPEKTVITQHPSSIRFTTRTFARSSIPQPGRELKPRPRRTCSTDFPDALAITVLLSSPVCLIAFAGLSTTKSSEAGHLDDFVPREFGSEAVGLEFPSSP
jgi:hypothetical protein